MDDLISRQAATKKFTEVVALSNNSDFELKQIAKIVLALQ